MQYVHRIYCGTEAGWVTTTKTDRTRLEACPNDPGHTVDLGTAEILSEIPPSRFEVNKEPGVVTKGFVHTDCIELAVPANGSASITRTWPYDLAIYTLRIAVTNECIGCILKAEVAPLTTVGALAADAPAGTTVISVTPSAAANIFPGQIVTLDQNSTSQELGRAFATDTTLNTITVEFPTTSLFEAAGPTKVQVTTRTTEGLELVIPGYLTFGEDRAVAVPFPKNRSMVMSATNPNANPARIVLYLSYNH